MSIKVTSYVWKHSKHRGTTKMLLLAMADFANDQGICWPSAATLAERINESERNTRRILADLVKAGDLLMVPGGGRGKTTHYAIALGMSPKQRDKINSVLQNTVSGNTDISETVTSDDGNSDIQGTETVTSGAQDEAPNSAPESAETAQNDEGIRHVDPSLDPIEHKSKRKPRVSRAESAHPDHVRLMQLYADALPDHRIPNGGREAKAAKEILAAGYTPEQAMQVYCYLKKQNFYTGKHLSLSTVNTEMGAALSVINSGGGYGPKNIVAQSGGMVRQPANAIIPNRPASAAQAAFEREFLRSIGVETADL